jgi:hypothetical protein
MNKEIHVPGPGQEREQKSPVQELLDQKWRATSQAERDGLQAKIDALLDAQEAADAQEEEGWKAQREQAADIKDRAHKARWRREFQASPAAPDSWAEHIAVAAQEARAVDEALADTDTIENLPDARQTEAKISFAADGGKQALEYLISSSGLDDEQQQAIRQRLADTDLKPKDLDVFLQNENTKKFDSLLSEYDSVALYKLKGDLSKGKITPEQKAELHRDVVLAEIVGAGTSRIPSAAELVGEISALAPAEQAETLEDKELAARLDYAKLREIVKVYQPQAEFPDFDDLAADAEAAVFRVNRGVFGIQYNKYDEDNLAVELSDRFQALAYTAETLAEVRKALPQVEKDAGKQSAA